MVLTKGQALLVLSTYKNFCKVFHRDGNITDKNFNRIRNINSYLNGKKYVIPTEMGNLFDEVYSLLETPQIKSRLEIKSRPKKEKKIPKIIKINKKYREQNKKHKKQKCSSKPSSSNEIIYIISNGFIKNINPGAIPVQAMEPYKEPTTEDWVMNEQKAEAQDYGGAK